MHPIPPEPRKNWQAVIFAKDQKQYLPLPANGDGRSVETKWQLTWKERLNILFKGHLYLTLLTFGNPLQPIRLSILRDPDKESLYDGLPEDETAR